MNDPISFALLIFPSSPLPSSISMWSGKAHVWLVQVCAKVSLRMEQSKQCKLRMLEEGGFSLLPLTLFPVSMEIVKWLEQQLLPDHRHCSTSCLTKYTLAFLVILLLLPVTSFFWKKRRRKKFTCSFFLSSWIKKSGYIIIYIFALLTH